MQPLAIVDHLVLIVTIVTQVLLARFFFTGFRRTVPQRVFLFWLSALAILWAITVLGVSVQTGIPHAVRGLPVGVQDFFEAAGDVWGVSAAASMAIYFGGRSFLRRVSPRFSSDRRVLMRGAGALAVGSPLAAMAFGAIVERTDFHVKEIDLPVPNLHPDLDGFRIAQVSDLHVSPFLSIRDAARVVDMTNELRPHLTIFTGDLISMRGDPLMEAVRELGRLRADHGVLGCLGNHEYFARCQDLETREAARYGILILRSQAQRLRVGQAVLNIAGVDYQSISQKAHYLSGAEKLIAPGAANLLLSHNPDVFPAAVSKGFDLVLAGHTHGGQVNVEILNQSVNVARFITPFVNGLYRIEGRSCYVTPGIGTIGMPVRLGARPEISLLRLRRA